MTPNEGFSTGDTNPRIRVRVDEVMRHVRRTCRHTASLSGPESVFDLDASLPGSAPWPVDPRTRPLWSPASWFSTLAVAGAVPLVIVYWMLN